MKSNLSNQDVKPIPAQVFRLCHLCGNLNEADEEILRCGSCGKGFLPMHYFERLKIRAQAAEQHDPQKTANLEAVEKLLSCSLAPVNGLIVIW